MEKVCNAFPMVIFTKDSFIKESRTVLESTIGLMAPTIKANSKWGKGTAMDYGKNQWVVVTNMKDNTYLIKNKDMVFSPGPMVMSSKDTIDRIKDKEMEKCIGSMGVIIKAIGIMVSKKERASFIVLMRESKREYLKIIKYSKYM